MKLKVCGMKYNVSEVAELTPDYLGFIFYEKSKRNYTADALPTLPVSTQKVGVFVDATIPFILEKIKAFDLDVLQLHGNESVEYIQELTSKTSFKSIDIWKVFSIKETFNFDVLTPYEPVVDAFLFDTKGPQKGGNGITFDWTVLNDYSSETPIVLSGGIGLNEVEQLATILKTDLPIMAIDINSRFEEEPGLKNINNLRTFKKAINL